MSSVALAWSGARSRVSVLTRCCSKRFTGVATRAGLRASRHSLSSVEYLFGQSNADNQIRTAAFEMSSPHDLACGSSPLPHSVCTSVSMVGVRIRQPKELNRKRLLLTIGDLLRSMRVGHVRPVGNLQHKAQ